jgi:hypothetical protein
MSWPSWATLEGQIRARAPHYGVNPSFAVAIAELESGHGTQMIGDDRSSFGPFQLHYGGHSHHFPHGGLGDVFTHQTGLHAWDSSSWQAQVDFSLWCFEHGDGAQWSTYRKAIARAGSPRHGHSPHSPMKALTHGRKR